VGGWAFNILAFLSIGLLNSSTFTVSIQPTELPQLRSTWVSSTRKTAGGRLRLWCYEAHRAARGRASVYRSAGFPGIDDGKFKTIVGTAMGVTEQEQMIRGSPRVKSTGSFGSSSPFRGSHAVAGFVVLTLVLAGAVALIRARDTAIANGELQHSASSPASTEDLAALGKRIFHDTQNEARLYVGAHLACASCHLNDGTTPYAAPMTGIAPLFPEFSQRAKRMISLKDRIDECFIRSENGRPLPEHGKEMTALVAYIESLSGQKAGGAKPSGRGLVKLPALSGSPQRGEAIYAAQCAACHGSDGTGVGSMNPPLWGSESFNDGAGMYRIENMAAFVVRNMPPTSPGSPEAVGLARVLPSSLTPQQAFDVSSYIHSKPRPKYNPAFDKY
jgi:thiosulfate dehydrogenase